MASIDSRGGNTDVWVPTLCDMCYNYCGIKVHVVNGVVVKIEGDPENPYNRDKVCAKGLSGIMTLYDPARFTKPLKRTNPEKGIGVDPKWVEISWEEALQTVAEWLRKIRSEDPRKLIFATFDYHPYSYVTAWGRAFGTPNGWAASAGYFCGNGHHPMAYLVHASFYTEPDYEYCKYFLFIGAQGGSVIGTDSTVASVVLAGARSRGSKLVVVDPICGNAARRADEWVPIRPGTDGALALGLLNVLLNETGAYDADFIRKKTNGPYLVGPDGRYVRDEDGKVLVRDLASKKAKPYDAPDVQEAIEGVYEVKGVACRPAFQVLREHVRKYTPEMVSDVTTIPAATVRRIAVEFGAAASSGGTIVIDGVQLPYRPAAVLWDRGASGHRHSWVSCWAIALLNVVVGACDVPGGLLGFNPAGPWWTPIEGPDGILAPAPEVAHRNVPYPPRKVEPPYSLEMREITPVAIYGRAFVPYTSVYPEKFKLGYKPEMMIHCRTNFLMTSADPEFHAKFMKDLKFIVSFAQKIEETCELADIVLPETTYLERSMPFPDLMVLNQRPDLQTEWYHQYLNPVAKPLSGTREWMEVLFELADRAGFRGDLYRELNNMLKLQDPHKLDPDERYDWDEIADRWAKSRMGDEHGRDYFRGHSFCSYGKKKVQEVYWRPFVKARIPLYPEFLIATGERIAEVTKKLDVEWDTGDYKPLPDWKPCPAYEEKSADYDLYVANSKLPNHTLSHSRNNAWLNELAERDPFANKILINKKTAKKKNIKNDDLIMLETAAGRKVKGKACVTGLVHPEVLGTFGCAGHWAAGQPVAKGKGIHFNALLPYTFERIDPMSGALDQCVKVKVSLAT